MRLGLLARDTDTRIVHPLLSPLFWNAVAEGCGPDGFASRTEGVRQLFGDLLPNAIIARNSKTCFDKVFWTEHARAFARALLEYVLALVLFIPWVIDMLFPLWDPMNQTLHDKATRTVVIKSSGVRTPVS